MKTLCIVPCGSKKIWDKQHHIGQCRAEAVYIGSFARKCADYARKFYPDSWCILSAKYGFLFPDDIVPGPYNVSFNVKSTKSISINELVYEVKEKQLDNYDEIIALGGKNYVTIIRQVFSDKEVQAPLTGCKGIGYMMSKLNEALVRGTPL